MKLFFPFLFVFSFVQASAINPIRVYEEKDERNNIVIFAENTSYCPYTFELKCDYKNMHSNVPLPYKIVLLPYQGKQQICKLTPIGNKKWDYQFWGVWQRGDATKAKHNDNAIYALPFKMGTTHNVAQGYDGKFSHQGKKSIDFSMPVGTHIHAARKGVVVDLKENSKYGCADKSCLDQGNYVTIYHSDGTFASYFHLDYKGVKVSVGDVVEQGQFIGLSGNTGWSSSPHLHFEVFEPTISGIKTVETYFYIRKDKKEKLKEGRNYKRKR